MLKSSALPFAAPFLKSQNKTKEKSSIPRTQITWSAASSGVKSTRAMVLPVGAQILSLALVVLTGALVLLHLFWVNTYSAKGIELTKVQNSISEQTELNKKLLVEQSMLGSTVSLSNLEGSGLVPITEEEHLNPNNFASIK